MSALIINSSYQDTRRRTSCHRFGKKWPNQQLQTWIRTTRFCLRLRVQNWAWIETLLDCGASSRKHKNLNELQIPHPGWTLDEIRLNELLLEGWMVWMENGVKFDFYFFSCFSFLKAPTFNEKKKQKKSSFMKKNVECLICQRLHEN